MTYDILVFTVIVFMGMLVLSFVGFGGGLLAIPILALLFSPKEVVPTFQLVCLIIFVVLVVEARKHIQWKRVLKLLIGGVIGVPIGACGLKHLPTHVIGLIISVVTFVFAVLFLLKIRISLKGNTAAQVCTGFLSGLLGGSISQSGPPVIIYGLARGWDKNSFRATLLSYFLVLSVMANLSYLCLGLLSIRSVITCSIAIGPAILAAWLGILLKNKVSETYFRYAVLIVIIAVSLIGVSRYAF